MIFRLFSREEKSIPVVATPEDQEQLPTIVYRATSGSDARIYKPEINDYLDYIQICKTIETLVEPPDKINEFLAAPNTVFSDIPIVTNRQKMAYGKLTTKGYNLYTDQVEVLMRYIIFHAPQDIVQKELFLLVFLLLRRVKN
jgi:hypothetical protein